ncbi:MAG TPA: mechanosensitive ion channel domain-containing protein [Candidatus Gracilibacteria bacterium]
MKRFVLGIILLLLLCPFSLQAQSNAPVVSESQGYIAGFMKAFSLLQEINGKITEKEIALKYEQDLTFPSLIEIDRIDKELEELDKDLLDLEDKFSAVIHRSGAFDETDEAIVESLLKNKQAEIEGLQVEKAEYQDRYNNRKNKQQENIKILKDELQDLQEEKDKQQQLIHTQGLKVLHYTVIIVLLVSFFWSLQWIVSKIIIRLSSNDNLHRQRILLRINHVVFNTILVIIIAGLFFAQLSTFLPFLAILGTGLAFAVRDTIASFIAWFVIGSDRGYEVGDIIEMKDIMGRVKDIGPILTVVEDRTPGYYTGETVTFPNKFIFEQKVTHKPCKMHLAPLEFGILISEQSDLVLAHETVKAMVSEANKATIENIKLKRVKILRQTPFTESDFEIKTWNESSIEGINIKIRFLAPWQQHKDLETSIRNQFVEWIKGNTKVFLQFTNVGRRS